MKKSVHWVEVDTPAAVAKLLSGEAVILLGWPLDYQEAHGANQAVSYILPKEGTALWSDNYVIPASSANAYTAATFINFLLRPEISARIVNEKNYPTANDSKTAKERIRQSASEVIDGIRRGHVYSEALLHLGPVFPGVAHRI